MKISGFSFMFIVSFSAGLLEASAVNPHNNFIQSGSSSGAYSGTYFGNYGPGRFGLKYVSSVPRGYNFIGPSMTPVYNRLEAGKIIGNGAISVSNPISYSASLPVNFPMSNAFPYGSSISGSNKIVRIMRSPSGIVNAHRPPSYSSGSKILGVFPSTTSNMYGNYNYHSRQPSVKVIRILNTSPSVTTAYGTTGTFTATTPQYSNGETHPRNHYQQAPRIYSNPMSSSIVGSPSMTPTVLPASNQSPTQTYQAPSTYSGSSVNVVGMSDLPPELANAIMKMLNEPPSSSIPSTISSPYVMNSTPIIASNSIDHTTSASSPNDVHVVKPLESGLTYSSSSSSNGIKNIRLGNYFQIYCDEDTVNGINNNYRQQHQQQPPDDEQQNQEQEQQHQHQNFVPSYSDDNNAISQIPLHQSNSLNELPEPEMDTQILRQFFNQ